MKLTSCRALKLEVLHRAEQLAVATADKRVYRLRKARGRRKRDIQVAEPTPVAAIGVAPGKANEYRLAVRLYKGCESYERDLMRGLDRHMNEIDLVTGVRYTPRMTLDAGGSIGHYKITAGTLGGFVEDNSNYYMMSNNHVFANSNQCFGGDPIVQPGPADSRDKTPTTVGYLDRWFPLSKRNRDNVDVAIATFSDDVEFFNPWDYTGVGRIKKTHVTDRMSVTRVIKRGRTTGVRRGRVSAFELDGIRIDYGTRTDPAIINFDGQIEIVGSSRSRAFSAPGDSGSFIIDQDTMQVYALLYAGGRDANGIDRTIANFIPDAFKAMKVKLVQ